MKSKVKIILTILAVLAVIYLVFVTIDVIRLRNSELGTKPLITVSEKLEEVRVTYNGLGYNVKYYINQLSEIKDTVKYIETYGYGAECRFLGILIWAWIE